MSNNPLVDYDLTDDMIDQAGKICEVLARHSELLLSTPDIKWFSYEMEGE